MSYIYGWEVPHAHIHLFPAARGKIAMYPKVRLGQLSAEEGERLAKKLALNSNRQ